MKRLITASLLVACAFLAADCATESGSVDVYGGFYYFDDPWYYGDCCANYPGDIGPPAPRPEHPIALPPGSDVKPSQPIEKAATTRSMPAPRSASMSRGGGGGGGRGGGRR